jgi:hypothetical protein
MSFTLAVTVCSNAAQRIPQLFTAGRLDSGGDEIVPSSTNFLSLGSE